MKSPWAHNIQLYGNDKKKLLKYPVKHLNIQTILVTVHTALPVDVTQMLSVITKKQ